MPRKPMRKSKGREETTPVQIRQEPVFSQEVLAGPLINDDEHDDDEEDDTGAEFIAEQKQKPRKRRDG